MKTILLFTLVLNIFLLGCGQNNPNTSQSNKIELDSSLLGFAKEFIKAYHCDQCINDITIDRITPDSSIITIRSLTPYIKYFDENPKRQKTEIEGISFFIYTGAEGFLKNIPIDLNEELLSEKECPDTEWTIISSKGRNILIKYGGTPFYYPDFNRPRSKIKFLPPDGKVGP